MSYNAIWKRIHLFAFYCLLGITLSGFLPAIELWHPVDLEFYHHKYEEELENDPLWGTKEPYGNPEHLEMQQAVREVEIEPRQAND